MGSQKVWSILSIRIAGPADDASTDEAALYDRQIRLWGVEAQNRHVEVAQERVVIEC